MTAAHVGLRRGAAAIVGVAESDIGEVADGLTPIDLVTGGIWPFELWVVAADTSCGKSVIMLQAALEGQGVAMGWRHLVAPLISQGLLVRPVPQSVTTDQPIYIVASRRGKLRPEAAHLRDWLVAEARSGEAG